MQIFTVNAVTSWPGVQVCVSPPGAPSLSAGTPQSSGRSPGETSVHCSPFGPGDRRRLSVCPNRTGLAAGAAALALQRWNWTFSAANNSSYPDRMWWVSVPGWADSLSGSPLLLLRSVLMRWAGEIPAESGVINKQQAAGGASFVSISTLVTELTCRTEVWKHPNHRCVDKLVNKQPVSTHLHCTMFMGVGPEPR